MAAAELRGGSLVWFRFAENGIGLISWVAQQFTAAIGCGKLFHRHSEPRPAALSGESVRRLALSHPEAPRSHQPGEGSRADRTTSFDRALEKRSAERVSNGNLQLGDGKVKTADPSLRSG